MRSTRIVLLAIALLALPGASFGSIFISVNFGPPPLPVYVQPPCPAPGYLWTPGYWSYRAAGYFWVPGVWVRPPVVGVLWTPGYWGFAGGVYMWHPGYWGPHVGFYGGINYGFGYFGVGFAGGHWAGRTFYYNRAVTNVNVNIHNVYVDRTVINRRAINYNRASFNGRGGVMARPTWQDRAAMGERHIAASGSQIAHERAASYDRSQFASVNHGRPSVTAMNAVNSARFNQQGRMTNGNSNFSNGESRSFAGREANFGRDSRPEQQAWRQQNSMSRSTYGDNHNNGGAPYRNSQAGWRSFSRSNTAQNFPSGRTPVSHAPRTERSRQSSNRQMAVNRGANGGRFSPQRNRNTNHNQNGAKRQTQRDKHNGNAFR
jgi:hypothetical protein